MSPEDRSVLVVGDNEKRVTGLKNALGFLKANGIGQYFPVSVFYEGAGTVLPRDKFDLVILDLSEEFLPYVGGEVNANRKINIHGQSINLGELIGVLK